MSYSRLLNQSYKAAISVQKAREEAIESVQSREAKEIVAASTRHAKAADRAAEAYLRFAEIGGRQFVFGKPGTGRAERTLAAKYREEAAHARDVAAHYRRTGR